MGFAPYHTYILFYLVTYSESEGFLLCGSVGDHLIHMHAAQL